MGPKVDREEKVVAVETGWMAFAPYSFFISCSSEDVAGAASLRKALNARGYGGFIAQVESRDLTDATSCFGWHVVRHRYFLAYLSMHAFDCSRVRYEWRVARKEHKKPCLVVLNGRDKEFLEILARASDVRSYGTGFLENLLRRLSGRLCRHNMEWAKAALLPFLLDIREQVDTGGVTVCWPPGEKIEAGLADSLHMRSLDEALAYFRALIARTDEPVSFPAAGEARSARCRRIRKRRHAPVHGLPSRGGAAGHLHWGGGRPAAGSEGAPDWISLYRRWVLEQPGSVRMKASEAADYADTMTIYPEGSGLRRCLSELPGDTMVIGYLTLEMTGTDWAAGYLSFCLDSTMDDVGSTCEIEGPYSSDPPVPDVENDFARWAIEQIAMGNLV